MNVNNSSTNVARLIDYFQFSCPQGGQFYICTNAWIEFIGCCEIDPCVNADGDCPIESLRSASFDPRTTEDLNRQDCHGPIGPGGFYTCEKTSPPFYGCCNVNPCKIGCPQDQLVPVNLFVDGKSRKDFLDAGLEATTSNVSSSKSMESNSTETGEGHNSKHDHHLSPDAIIALYISVMLFTLIVVGLLIWNKW